MAVSFFEQGGARLADKVRPGSLCAFDFDGTLAPIVTNPDRAGVSVAV
jgi:trehalose 6-phosphate phosphatase